MLEDVGAEAAKLAGLGEFTAEVQEELNRSFLPDRISDTLNIEGVRVNPRLTRAVLDGLAISDSDRYTTQEILNVSAANALIESEARAGYPLSVQLVQELHRRIEENLIPTAGSFREEDVEITGATHRPPVWSDVPGLTREVCGQYEDNRSVNPLVRAVWLHANIAKIHPFVDGNGRTARMLQDFALLSSKLLPVGVPMSRRTEYYDALEASDTGDFNQVVSLIANAELAALDKAVRVAEAPKQRRRRIEQLVKAANATTKRTEYNQYEIWRRKAEGFVSELGKWIEELNEASDSFRFRYQTYDVPSFEKWSEVRHKGWATFTWLFRLDAIVQGRMLARFLFFARRHNLGWTTDPNDDLRKSVGIFVESVDDPSQDFSFGRYEDRYIRLRELVIDAPQLVAYHDPAVQPSEMPSGIDVTVERLAWEPTTVGAFADVIEDLISDILVKLGLIDT
ncbi:Fic family protein [Mycobacterium marinum]|uniref:Fic family protein n=1 Tax=Mycobacterium marinum TaxID=1781 RepID=UPI0018CB2791|nr:Fic family protein [Mycobacterium marinum]